MLHTFIVILNENGQNMWLFLNHTLFEGHGMKKVFFSLKYLSIFDQVDKQIGGMMGKENRLEIN